MHDISVVPRGGAIAVKPAAGTTSACTSSDAFPHCANLCVEVLVDGEDGSPKPATGDLCEIHYSCLIRQSGGCVDSSRSKMYGTRKPFELQLGAGQAVSGMEQGVRALRLGALARLHVPSHLAYGANRVGVIPPHSDLIFEVELLKVGDHRAPPMPIGLIRQLFVLPPAPGLATRSAEGQQLVRMPRELLLAAEQEAASVEAAAARSDPDDEVERAAEGLADTQLPTWLSRLRSVLRMPTPECATFFKYLSEMRAALDAHAAAVSAGGALPEVLPGAATIARVPYGTPWDSKRPLVLTGVREGWPALNWGWSFWEGQHGTQQVLCKQRAPMFDSDQSSATLMAECSLREALQYARKAHRSRAPEQGDAPVLYMNGWDVFEALPQLWDEAIDKLPGTIDNKTVSEYRRLYRQMGMDDEEMIIRKARSLCKLFVGACGAITRMHQDNHNAHAWLTNLRGRKLYVLSSPDEDASLIAPRGRASQDGGSTREARLDPLDAHQRVARSAVQLYAVVLEPGETILAPNGWWHYAACIEPTITLMCNFWDDANMFGLHDCFYDQTARALDASRKDILEQHRAGKPLRAGTKVPPTVTADLDAGLRQFDAPVQYAVTHAPWIYLRAEPSTDAEVVAVSRPGKILWMSHALDGWLRTADPVHQQQYGWALEAGTQLGLGVLLTPVPT